MKDGFENRLAQGLKNHVFRAPRPFLSEPADPRLSLRIYRVFFRWGVYY